MKSRRGKCDISNLIPAAQFESNTSEHQIKPTKKANTMAKTTPVRTEIPKIMKNTRQIFKLFSFNSGCYWSLSTNISITEFVRL